MARKAKVKKVRENYVLVVKGTMLGNYKFIGPFSNEMKAKEFNREYFTQYFGDHYPDSQIIKLQNPQDIKETMGEFYD